MRAGRIVAMIAGALLALAGFGAALAGGALVVVHATQRDASGFYTSSLERFTTPTAALVAQADLDTPDWPVARPLGTVRVQAAATESRPIFVGIGPADDVEAWLAGTTYTTVGRLDPDSTRVVNGSRPVTPPTAQPFWAASQAGTGPQTISWPSEPGRWALVVMNPDAQPGVSAEVTVGARTGALLPLGVLVGSIGLVLLGAGVLIMLAAALTAPPGDAVPAPAGRPGTYPVRLDGRLDPSMSRWLWLLKWVLVIPHGFVLAFLWLAAVPLTVVAGFAILFTGRYPRRIFDFNVGVLRWTWRVWFYGYGALGTDRYPPFRLGPDPTYPADLAVEYPQRLSRGLVLVKWWLLAIPHYLVVAVFAGGWIGWVGSGDDWRLTLGSGLVGLLVVVAAVVLLFSGRYPEPLYDFVLGMDRWCFRVAAYAMLMRDEYPPFRFDEGGTDPGSVPPQPVSPRDSGAQLIGTAR